MEAVGAFPELLENLWSIEKEFLGLEQKNNGTHSARDLYETNSQNSQRPEQKHHWLYMTKSIDFTEVIQESG